jgi:hypothetical protein
MTTAAHNLLNAFDALAPAEKQSVAMEILRRAVSVDELKDEAFDEIAAEIFQGYDAEEADGAQS